MCKQQNSFNPITDTGDLPATSLMGIRDPFLRLEKLSPFSRLHVLVFMEKINALGKETADIPLLAGTFNTPAWQG